MSETIPKEKAKSAPPPGVYIDGANPLRWLIYDDEGNKEEYNLDPEWNKDKP